MKYKQSMKGSIMSKYDRPIRTAERCSEEFISESISGKMTHKCLRDSGHIGDHTCEACFQQWPNTTEGTDSYWQRELDKVTPDELDQIKVQFRGENSTHWFNLTPQQFEQIKGFMLSIEEGLI